MPVTGEVVFDEDTRAAWWATTYAHGNQPIQHMIYLYNYADEPWKAQYWVREVMDRMYNANPDGYCGDEDNGQTSVWYVFSALGLGRMKHNGKNYDKNSSTKEKRPRTLRIAGGSLW